MDSEAQLLELQQTLYTSKNPTRRWLHCTRRDWIIETIRQHGSDLSGKALEVGPGSGIYLPVLASQFREVVAADIEEAYLKYATTLVRHYPNIEVMIDDITASSLSTHSFDLVLCTEVVEHIHESRRAIAEMHRLLKPGGALILSTPQRYSPLELAARIAFLPGVINLVRMIYREPILETGHINLMTTKNITSQLRDAGFTIRTSHKSGVYLPLIAEFAGEHGLRLEKWLEPKLRKSLLNGLLWTQYFVALA